jgi:ankyrin repeat protein
MDAFNYEADNEFDDDPQPNSQWTNVGERDGYYYQVPVQYISANSYSRKKQRIIRELAVVNAVRNGDYYGPVMTRVTDYFDIINKKGKTKKSALMYACQYAPLQILQKLLNAGATVHDVDGRKNRSPLHFAVLSGSSQKVQAIIRAGALVNTVDSDWNTPLHYASTNGKFKIAAALIEADANVNAKNKFGYTPLMFAAENGSARSIRCLLFNQSPSVSNLERTCRENPELKLHKALKRLQIQLNVKNKFGQTALMRAMKFQNARATRILLDHPKIDRYQISAEGSDYLNIPTKLSLEKRVVKNAAYNQLKISMRNLLKDEEVATFKKLENYFEANYKAQKKTPDYYDYPTVQYSPVDNGQHNY